MKYATYHDFVREAYYHGVDAIAEPEGNELDWALVQECIDKRLFEDAERILRQKITKIVVPGVITYFETEEQVKEAYKGAA